MKEELETLVSQMIERGILLDDVAVIRHIRIFFLRVDDAEQSPAFYIVPLIHQQLLQLSLDLRTDDHLVRRDDAG